MTKGEPPPHTYDTETARDAQTAYETEVTHSPAFVGPALYAPEQAAPFVGEYAADYSPLMPGALDDADVDAELDAMLAASIVVHRNEGA